MHFFEFDQAVPVPGRKAVRDRYCPYYGGRRHTPYGWDGMLLDSAHT